MVILCVNSGDSKKVIEDYWTKSGFTLTAVRQESNAVSDAFGVIAYPTNYLIGPDGNVLWRAVGADEAGIRRHLLP